MHLTSTPMYDRDPAVPRMMFIVRDRDGSRWAFADEEEATRFRSSVAANQGHIPQLEKIAIYAGANEALRVYNAWGGAPKMARKASPAEVEARRFLLKRVKVVVGMLSIALISMMILYLVWDWLPLRLREEVIYLMMVVGAVLGF